MMDPLEKEVIKRKKQTIASFLRMEATDIRHFSQLGLLTPSMRKNIQAVEGSSMKAVKFLNLIRKRKKRQQFDALVSALDWGDYSWLADELDAELRLARGELPLDELTVLESGVVVRRALSITKRISEGEKRTLELLIARRTVCTREVWKNQVQKVKERQGRADLVAQDMDLYTTELADKVQEFINHNEGRISLGPMLSTQSTTMILLGDTPKKKTPLKELKDRLGQLMRLTSQCFLAVESAQKEKAQTLKVMQLEDYDEDIAIDQALEYALEAASRESFENQIRAVELEYEAHTLGRKVTRVQRELTMVADSKDRDVTKVKDSLLTCVLRMQQLADIKAQLNNQLYFVQEELMEYKHDVEKLERSKRLIHLYPELKERNAERDRIKKIPKIRHTKKSLGRMRGPSDELHSSTPSPGAKTTNIEPKYIVEQDKSNTDRPQSSSTISTGSSDTEMLGSEGISPGCNTPVNQKSDAQISTTAPSGTANSWSDRNHSFADRRSTETKSARKTRAETSEIAKVTSPRPALRNTNEYRSSWARSPTSPDIASPPLPILGQSGTTSSVGSMSPRIGATIRTASRNETSTSLEIASPRLGTSGRNDTSKSLHIVSSNRNGTTISPRIGIPSPIKTSSRNESTVSNEISSPQMGTSSRNDTLTSPLIGTSNRNEKSSPINSPRMGTTNRNGTSVSSKIRTFDRYGSSMPFTRVTTRGNGTRSPFPPAITVTDGDNSEHMMSTL